MRGHLDSVCWLCRRFFVSMCMYAWMACVPLLCHWCVYFILLQHCRAFLIDLLFCTTFYSLFFTFSVLLCLPSMEWVCYEIEGVWDAKGKRERQSENANNRSPFTVFWACISRTLLQMVHEIPPRQSFVFVVCATFVCCIRTHWNENDIYTITVKGIYYRYQSDFYFSHSYYTALFFQFFYRVNRKSSTRDGEEEEKTRRKNSKQIRIIVE